MLARQACPQPSPLPVPTPWGAGVGRPKAQGARILKASPLGKTVWARRTEQGRGVQDGQQDTCSWLWASISTTAGSRRSRFLFRNL